MRPARPIIGRLKDVSQLSPSRLLAAAIVFHLILVFGIYAAGRLKLTRAINENGIATTIAPDSQSYLSEVAGLADTLTQRGLTAWRAAPVSFHNKLYSLPFIILRPLLGANILSVEPLNLFCFIALLSLTFRLGQEVFDRRVGLTAAAAVGLWPSFLIHTSQILKDPLFIVALLGLILIFTSWLTKRFSLAKGLMTGIAGATAACLIGLTRSSFWGALILGITLLGIAFLVIRQLRERRVLWGNMISALLILSAAIVLLLFPPGISNAAPVLVDSSPAGTRSTSASSTNSNESAGSLRQRADLAARQVWQLRQEFIRLNRDSGSNIEADVKFDTAMDVLRYLPKALLIGFLAPFPNQWFTAGKQVGLAGRLISGLEMTAIYLVELLALVGLWRSRASLPAWLFFSVTLVSLTALALVVINVGALYRMRYGFLILLIILAANGLMSLVTCVSEKRGAGLSRESQQTLRESLNSGSVSRLIPRVAKART